MADSIGMAANGLQLVDPAKLVSMILKMVETVKRNKKEGRDLGEGVKRLDNMLPSSAVKLHEELREFLEALKDTLRQAYELVQSCQKRNSVFRFLRAWREAQQLREIREKIDEFLKDFPVLSHANLAHEIHWIKRALKVIIGLLLSLLAAVCFWACFF